MDPAFRSPLAVPRLGRRLPHGTVALVDRASITVAELAVGPLGVRVRRHVLAFNGRDEMRFLESDPDSVAAMLARVLRDNGFSNRLACVGLFESMFGATLCELPRTTPAATAALLERRVREQIVAPGEDLLADHACVAEAPGTPLRALLAWASRSQLDRYAAAFRREGLRVRRVVPPSVALLDLFGRTRVADPERLELFARYCYPSMVIGVHRGDRPLYLRFLPDVMADADEGVVSTLLTEVLRTATFVAESQQGRTLSGVTFSGLTASDASRFTLRLRDEAGLDAQPQHVDVDGPDLGADPERLAALTGLLVHGTHLARHRVRSMNMLPGTERPLARTVATLLAVALVTSVIAFTSLGLARGAARVSAAEVHGLEAGFEELVRTAPERQALLDALQRTETQRATLAFLRTAAGNPVQPLLGSLLLLPAGAVPIEGRFENTYAAGGEAPSLSLRLQGDFSGAGSAALDHLAAELRAQPWCAALSMSRGAVRVEPDQGRVTEDVALGMELR
ncbi:MAG TPA: hypothetical protein VK824_05760 [Planctomycetota bacterium]|nr:hypothetical protein [Planctomycetota bacterium]